MSPDSSMNGWHSTDDEQIVPVRSSVPATHVAQESSPSSPAAVRQPQGVPDPRSMRYSAALGIFIVLGFASVYFGLENLRGDLSENGSALTVVITPEGTFSPSTLDVRPNDVVTIENKNSDPQVLKSKDNRDLFPVQVLFDSAYTFTVPVDAVGTYTYFSETLPDTVTVQFVVVENESPSGEVASSVSESSAEIPLPFGTATTAQPSINTESHASGQPDVSAATPAVIEHSADTASIRLGGNAAYDNAPSAAKTEIPSNPYTVDVGMQKEQQMQQVNAAIVREANLHSGASLQPITSHTPRRTTETGPGGMLLLLIPSLLGVRVMWKRSV